MSETAEVVQPGQRELTAGKPEKSGLKKWLLRRFRPRRPEEVRPVSGGAEETVEQTPPEEKVAGEEAPETLNNHLDWELVKHDVEDLTKKVAEEQLFEQGVNKKLEQKAAEANQKRKGKQPPGIKPAVEAVK